MARKKEPPSGHHQSYPVAESYPMPHATQRFFNAFAQLGMSQQHVKKGNDFFELDEDKDIIFKAYETIRNSVEYSEDHLLLRGAIDRFLRRNFHHRNTKRLVERLLRDLTMSGYIENKSIHMSTVHEIVVTVEAYQKVLSMTDYVQTRKQYEAFIGIVSAHVLDEIRDSRRVQMITDFIHNHICYTERWQPEPIGDIASYIAVERAIFKSDEPTINSRIFRKLYGADILNRPHAVAEAYGGFQEQIEVAQRSQRLTDATTLLRRRSAAMITLVDILFDTHDPNVLKDPRMLGHAVQASTEGLYKRANDRLWRGIIRSLIFLILTKALIGVAIEVPYDLWLHGEIKYVPLVINLVFPPIYLLMTSLIVRMPDAKNTEQIHTQIEKILFRPEKLVRREDYEPEISSKLMKLFNSVYFVLSMIIFGGLLALLYSLGFNAVGLAVFIIYFSSVSYFSYRVTNVVRELKTYTRRDGDAAASFIAILTTPFVRLGQWLSARYQSFNIVVFIFDFLIEAPVKSISTAMRRWKSFLKDKQDDAL